MIELLKKIEEKYDLFGEDSAFEILSGVIILKKSVVSIFSNNWLKMKQNSGKYCNSSKDGKIDLIDVSIDDTKKQINISFIQVENSNSMKKTKIQLFVNSAFDYLINNKSIEEEDCIDLKYYQDIINNKKKEHEDYSINYTFYISYNGVSSTEKTLEKCVNDLGLPNVKCEVFNKNKLNKGLKKVIDISNHPVDINYNIYSSENLIEYNNDRFKSITMLVDASELYKMINTEQEKNIELNRLFNNNVRGFLDNSSINSQIKETIVKHSDSFYYCNNGATVFCDDVTKQSSSSAYIVNPRIINGQQSIASIYLYGKDSNAKMLVKFISTIDNQRKEEMMNLFCMTTNSSNQIKPINLISNSKLIIETKKYLSKNNVGLSIKEGNLLNNIFMDDFDIDLEDLLKIWATLYLNRPDFAKAKERIVKIFYKAELDEEKYVVLKSDEAINIIKEELYLSYCFLDSVKSIVEKLKEKEYYTHGQYVIIFMIYLKYGIKPDVSKININEIAKELEKYIEDYKKEYEKKGKSYSLNNYFKGTRPLKDLNIDIKNESDYIKELESKIS